MKNVETAKEALFTTTRSTSTQRDLTSGANWIAYAPEAVRTEFLNSLSEGTLLALPHLFEFWGYEHQLPPKGDWLNWVIMGGRGAGKTRAGSEWVRAQVEGAMPLDKGRCSRIALIGETQDQVREVMIFGESGIMNCVPADRRPVWRAGRKLLEWPNGAVAQVFSAHEPEALRGPQFDGAWVDELAKWKRAKDTWDMLQFGLRLGEAPRVCITTTPRNIPVLKTILANPKTVVTSATTEANAAHLADSFLEEVRARYAGTRLGRQELDGVLLDDVEGALWRESMMDGLHVDELPEMDRIVVAVDPPVTGRKDSDLCGIVAVGAVTQGPVQNWRAYVLADCTIGAASPATWANAAIRSMEHWGAERLVAEVNQGGDMVESVVRQVDPLVPFKKVHATRGKVLRAEPVAALYEQGRVFHTRGLGDLEDQMQQMTTQGFIGKGSPDRVDALVWALHDLLIEPAAKWRRPNVRTL